MSDFETMRTLFYTELDRVCAEADAVVATLYRRGAEGGYTPVIWSPRKGSGVPSYVGSASDLASYLRKHSEESCQIEAGSFKDGSFRRGLTSFGVGYLFAAPLRFGQNDAYYITVASVEPLGAAQRKAAEEAVVRLCELMLQASLRAQVRSARFSVQPHDRLEHAVEHVAECESILIQAHNSDDFDELLECVAHYLPAECIMVEDAAGVRLARFPKDVPLRPTGEWLLDVSRLPYLDMLECAHGPVSIPSEFDERGQGRIVFPLRENEDYLGAISFVGFSEKELDRFTDIRRAARFAFTYLLRRREAGRGRILRRTLNSLENERLRVACELHDSASQDLVALKVRMATCELAMSKGDQKKASQILQDCMCIADGILDSVNRLAADLRPSELNYLGLRQAIESEASRRLGRASISYSFSGNALDVHFNPLQESMLLTGVVEALSNCARHSKAKHVEISIDSAKGWLTLAVRDNGCGFEVEANGDDRHQHRYGLETMRDCAEAIGGAFWIGSELKKGTTVRFSAPMRLLEEGSDE